MVVEAIAQVVYIANVREHKNYMIRKPSESWESGRAKTVTLIVTKDCQIACKYCYLVGKDMSTSWCHYDNLKTERRLISPDDLQAGILFAMKHNLAIQFVYPPYQVSPACRKAIESIDHIKIAPAESEHDAEADVLVASANLPFTAERIETFTDKILILRTGKRELGNNGILPLQSGDDLITLANRVKRLNIIITVLKYAAMKKI